MTTISSTAQTFIDLGSPREAIPETLLVWGNGALDKMSFDVTISEDHDSDAMVTEHTVEQGTDVVDHVRPEPKRLRLEVFVSNTPITPGDDRDFLPFTVSLGTPGDHSPPGDKSVEIDWAKQGDRTFFAGGLGGMLQNAIDAGARKLGLGTLDSTPPVDKVGNPWRLFEDPRSQVTFQVLQFDGETDYVANAFATLDLLLNTGTLIQVFTPKRNYANMVIKSLRMRRDKNTGTSGFITIDFKEIRMVASAIVDAPLPSILAATPPADKGKQDPKVAPPADVTSMRVKAFQAGNRLPGDLAPGF